jgi:hypothetical protein
MTGSLADFEAPAAPEECGAMKEIERVMQVCHER